MKTIEEFKEYPIRRAEDGRAHICYCRIEAKKSAICDVKELRTLAGYYIPKDGTMGSCWCGSPDRRRCRCWGARAKCAYIMEKNNLTEEDIK